MFTSDRMFQPEVSKKSGREEKMKKKYISLILVLMMILSTASVFADAEDEIQDQNTGNDIELNEQEPDDGDQVLENGQNETPDEENGDVPTSENDTDLDTELDADAAEPQRNFLLLGAEKTVVVTATQSGNSVTVEWTYPDEITNSRIEVTKNGIAAEGLTKEFTDSTATWNYSGLTEGKYVFKVTVNYSDEDQGATGEAEAVVALPAAVTLRTYSSYKGVALEWTKDSKAVTYEIYRDNVRIKSGQASAFKNAYDNAKLLSFIDTGAGDEKWHSYYVKSTYNKASVKSNTCSDQMVMPFYIKLQFKQAKKLKPHGGKKVSHKFKKGDVVYATGFVKGQYHFWYKGTLYYVNYNRTTKQKALYNGKGGKNYAPKEVEYFINNSGQTSMTNYMIYVNLYTQHLYILTGKANTKGKWRVAKINYKGSSYSNWEISSGTAKTPSPWGLNLKYKKKLVNKYKKLKRNPGHGSKYWNFYHSQTALHGRADKKGYGAPYSHGCIRSTDAQGLFLLNVIPIKSRVAIY